MPSKHQPQQREPKGSIEVIDPRWLLKAGAAAFLVALLLAYLTLCLLFYQGQWQLVLAPSATVASTPASLALSFEPVTFGSSQLKGWWLPSDSSSDPTALLLHDGHGNMADALTSAQTLHAARLNVFVFDYRGFGTSPGPHPTQARMQEDAASALEYLLHTRHLAPAAIILYGEGIGAALAAHLAAQHTDVAALMLISPAGDLTAQVKQDPRAHLAPASLLFHETFPLAKPLQTLTMPKLILSFADRPAALDLKQAADPKLTVELPASHPPSEPLRSIDRFIGTYLYSAPPQLHPQ